MIFSFWFQVAIEVVTYWDKGFGVFNISKNVIVIAFGIIALIFGSKDAIEGIKEVYYPVALTNATSMHQ